MEGGDLWARKEDTYADRGGGVEGWAGRGPRRSSLSFYIPKATACSDADDDDDDVGRSPSPSATAWSSASLTSSGDSFEASGSASAPMTRSTNDGHAFSSSTPPSHQAETPLWWEHVLPPGQLTERLRQAQRGEDVGKTGGVDVNAGTGSLRFPTRPGAAERVSDKAAGKRRAVEGMVPWGHLASESGSDASSLEGEQEDKDATSMDKSVGQGESSRSSRLLNSYERGTLQRRAVSITATYRHYSVPYDDLDAPPLDGPASVPSSPPSQRSRRPSSACQRLGWDGLRFEPISHYETDGRASWAGDSTETPVALETNTRNSLEGGSTSDPFTCGPRRRPTVTGSSRSAPTSKAPSYANLRGLFQFQDDTAASECNDGVWSGPDDTGSSTPTAAADTGSGTARGHGRSRSGRARRGRRTPAAAPSAPASSYATARQTPYESGLATPSNSGRPSANDVKRLADPLRSVAQEPANDDPPSSNSSTPDIAVSSSSHSVDATKLSLSRSLARPFRPLKPAVVFLSVSFFAVTTLMTFLFMSYVLTVWDDLNARTRMAGRIAGRATRRIEAGMRWGKEVVGQLADGAREVVSGGGAGSGSSAADSARGTPAASRGEPAEGYGYGEGGAFGRQGDGGRSGSTSSSPPGVTTDGSAESGGGGNWYGLSDFVDADFQLYGRTPYQALFVYLVRFARRFVPSGIKYIWKAGAKRRMRKGKREGRGAGGDFCEGATRSNDGRRSNWRRDDYDTGVTSAGTTTTEDDEDETGVTSDEATQRSQQRQQQQQQQQQQRPSRAPSPSRSRPGSSSSRSGGTTDKGGRIPSSSALPPRPPLSVLISSILFTIIVALISSFTQSIANRRKAAAAAAAAEERSSPSSSSGGFAAAAAAAASGRATPRRWRRRPAMSAAGVAAAAAAAAESRRSRSGRSKRSTRTGRRSTTTSASCSDWDSDGAVSMGGDEDSRFC